MKSRLIIYTLIDAKGNVGHTVHCTSKCDTIEEARKYNEKLIKATYRVTRFDHINKVAHVVTFAQDDPRKGYITPKNNNEIKKEETNKFFLKDQLFNPILNRRKRVDNKYYVPKNIHERKVK